MGAIKRFFGGGSQQTTVQQVATEPTVTAVTNADTEADTTNSTTDKKKRKGFASTRAANTVLENTDAIGTKNTLG